MGSTIKYYTMDKYNRIKELLYRYEKYGVETTSNGTILIGHPDYLPELWRLVEIFPKLDDKDIDKIREECAMNLPYTYEKFLRTFCNGFNFISGTLSLFGLRKIEGRSIEASRQSFALKLPNNTERCSIENVRDSYFFIGSYDWDGSRLYIDKDTEKVHLCARYDATSLLSWDSLEDMLIAELTRLYSLFTEDGRQIDESRTTLPL